MSDESSLEKVAAEKEELAELKMDLLKLTEEEFARRILDQTRSRFVEWLRRYGAATSILVAAVGFLGLKVTADQVVKTAIDAQVRQHINEIDQKLDAIQLSLSELEVEELEEQYVGLSATVESLLYETDIASERLTKFNDLAEKNLFINNVEFSQQIRNIIADIRGNVLICGEFPAEELEAQTVARFEVHLAGSFKVHLGGYESFNLSPFDQNGFMIDSRTLSSEINSNTCISRELYVRQTKGTPEGMLSNELPALSYFRAAPIPRQGSKLHSTDEERANFRRFWNDVSVRFYLQVNGNGEGFGVKGSDVYEPTFGFVEADDYRLHTVDIRETENSRGESHLVADYTLLESVTLEDIQNK